MKATYKQTFIGIWFRDKNLSIDRQDKMRLYLNRTFYYYRIFDDKTDFYGYIDEERLIAKVFLIISISDSSLDSLVELTQQWPNFFQKVYIFLRIKSGPVACYNTDNIDELFKHMNEDIQDFIGKTKPSNRVKNEVPTEPKSLNTSLIDRPQPSLSVLNSKCQQTTPIRHLTKESLNFLCFLTMTNILCRIPNYKPEDLSEMWVTCHKIYEDNNAQLDRIDELQKTYTAQEAIEHYTGNSCLFRTVNQACHTEDLQRMFTFRVYISHLHKQLVQYHEQEEKDNRKPGIQKLYRGKPLSGSVLQQLVDNEGGLISMNGFLSTTRDRNVSAFYHGDEQVSKDHNGYKPVLFKLEVKKTLRQPYADIAPCSTKPDEAEVLFSLGTIWCIKSIELNEDLCIIELISCDDLDSQSTELLNKYTKNDCNLSSVGDILFELGDDKEAEWFYEKTVKQDSLDEKTLGSLYYKIGMIRFERKDYSVALERFEKAVSFFPLTINESDEIREPMPLYVCDKQSRLIAIYNNMGLMHGKDGEFDKAVNCYQQALSVKNGSRSEIATVNNNLGLLYYYRGNYQEAREHHMKAIELIDESHLTWVEFKRNFDRADQRCQHLMKKKLNN